MGHLRQQPQSEVLLDHQTGAQTTGRRYGVLGATRRRDGPGAGDAPFGRRDMSEMLRRLTSSFRKQRLDCDLDAELAAHLELATDEYMQQGLTREEARRR